MEPSNVKGYCQHIFSEARIDSFVSWWLAKDPELNGVPNECAADMPTLVIERAEAICDMHKQVRSTV